MNDIVDTSDWCRTCSGKGYLPGAPNTGEPDMRCWQCSGHGHRTVKVRKEEKANA